MSEYMSKAELQVAMEREYTRWKLMLKELDGQRMVEPGVVGEWSVKDIAAHIMVWQRRLVQRLQASLRGEGFTPAGFDQLSIDDRNAIFYEETREMSLPQVLATSSLIYRRLNSLVQELSEEELNDPLRFDWLNGSPLWLWIKGDSYEHYQEHIASIQDWLLKTTIRR